LTEVYLAELQTQSILRERAIQDSNKEIRSIAIGHLTKNFSNDPQTFEILRNRTKLDTEKRIRCLAIRELARNFSNDPQTLELLRDLASHDGSPEPDERKSYSGHFVRKTAIDELAKVWRMQSFILPFLTERAKNDPSLWLRIDIQDIVRDINAEITFDQI
jgi:hypothetical protein